MASQSNSFSPPSFLFFLHSFLLHSFLFLGHVLINVCPIQVQDTLLDLTNPRREDNRKY